MQSAQEIYRNTISRLPTEERLQLAALILRDLAGTKDGTKERLSVVKMIDSFKAVRSFKTSAEADEYLREERDSWDR